MARLDARELGSWDEDVASLAGSLVHEVKNPLSTLSINTQLILEEWPHPSSPREERSVKRLQVMKSEIDRIEHIVNSFLRLVRQNVLATVSVDLNELLHDMISSNEEGWSRSGIQVRFEPNPELPTIQGDESLLRQAFLNLFRNAEQAMPHGGELIVRTRPEGHNEVQVEVTDTGGGIPADRLTKIFQPYFSSTAGGTGLGLPTTLRIVRQHGGFLVVESEVGKGCQFVIQMPAVARLGEEV